MSKIINSNLPMNKCVKLFLVQINGWEEPKSRLKSSNFYLNFGSI